METSVKHHSTGDSFQSFFKKGSHNMKITNPYLQKVYQQVCQRDANEPEFLNAVTEVLGTLEPVILHHPEYEAAGLLERMVEPERAIQFPGCLAGRPGQNPGSTAPGECSLTLPSVLTRAVCGCIPASTCRSSSSSHLSRPSKTA